MRPLSPALACDPHQSVVVEACAGSGKTWLLTARILRTLLSGVRPGRILALTFTEAAAGEMKARLRRRLREWSEMSPEAGRQALAEIGLSGEELEDALRRLPGLAETVLLDPHPATICTFHSWYRRLLAASPLKRARLKTYRLTAQSEAFRRACRQDQLETLAKVAPELLDCLVGRLGLHTTERLLAGALSRRAAEATRPGRQLEAASLLATPQRIRDQLSAILQQEATILSGLESDWDSAWRPQVARLQSLFQSKLPPDHAGYRDWMPDFSPEGVDAQGLQRRVRKALLTDKGTPRKSILVKPAQRVLPEGTMDLLADMASALQSHEAQVAAARHLATERLLQLVAGLSLARRAQLEAERDEVDFDGLEALAIGSVCGPEGALILSRLDLRVEHLLVDEFQDTSPAQWALLRTWLEHYTPDSGLEAPRVFLVGDPKQSIYAFRGAQAGVFEAAAQWLETRLNAQWLQTDTTRRCGPAVVDALNQLMITEGAWATTPIRAHAGHRTSQLEGMPGLAAVIPLEDGVESEEYPALQEGRRIGGVLQRLRQDHPRLAWSGVRLLVARRTHLPDLERGLLDQGVPFFSDRGGGLLHQPVIRDFLALCQWLAYPWAVAEREQAYRSGHLRLEEQGVDDERVSGWRLLSQTHPVQELLQLLMNELGLGRRQALGHELQALQDRADLECLLSLALEADEGRSPSLARFLDQMRLLAEAPEQEAPAVGLLPDALEGIRIQTLHGSKGLEAPVVVLAGLGTRGRSPDDLEWVEDWSPGWEEFRGLRLLSRRVASLPADLFVGDLADLADLPLLLEREQKLDRQQLQNLLYVGLTRAQDSLLLSTRGRDGGKSPLWDQACQTLSPTPVEQRS